MPSGLLLRKRSVHSSVIIKIMEYKSNHLVTVSKNEVKIWGLSGIVMEEESVPALKQYNSLLDILDCWMGRKILLVLTNQGLTLLNGSISQNNKELKVIKKTDYEYATAMAISETKVFVGDGKGEIYVEDLVVSEEEKL